MLLEAILLCVALLCASGFAAVAAGRSNRLALAIGTAGAVMACAAGLAAAVAALLTGARGGARAAWPMPAGEIHVGLDPLSSFFLVCIFLVSGLSALYGAGYLRAEEGARRLAPAVLFFNLLVASMAVVALARDGVLFLLAWEVMTLSSFFLVTFESEREEVRRAGMTYLIASQLGVAFVFVLLGLLGRCAASYDFDVLARGIAPGLAGLAFLLAVVGFGTKAGFWPVHVWLPDAHPAAPSHVSALMSGVMIKMGIYGLLRTLTFLGSPPAWWGALLIAVGSVSGLIGILHALAQRDLKRRLAYSSVENVGIITLGIGLALWGRSRGDAAVAFLGYAGALLHVLNHGLFKGLLFQSAGSVLRATGTRDMDRLGGLYRRLPVTGTAFLVGAVAISGLPPLNGFVGEWLLYVGAIRAGSSFPGGWGLWTLAVVPALALIGGLAAACFVGAFGHVFLGLGRTDASDRAHEAGPSMQAAMALGILGCLAIGLWPAGALAIVSPAAALLSGASPSVLDSGPFLAITRATAALLAVCLVLALIRRALLRRSGTSDAATWGCAYAAPSPRMQYSPASFVEPILSVFGPVVHSRVERQAPRGFFPESARHEEYSGDLAGERLLLPAARRLARGLSRLRVLQQGRLQLYLVYIAVTLVLLLIWQLAGTGR